MIVTDSFGRHSRQERPAASRSITGADLLDLRGTADRAGSPLRTTQVALADELAAALLISCGRPKRTASVVIATVRAVVFGDGGDGLVIPADHDLFR